MMDSQLHARTAPNLGNKSLLSKCITNESHNSVHKVEDRKKPSSRSRTPFVQLAAYQLYWAISTSFEKQRNAPICKTVDFKNSRSKWRRWNTGKSDRSKFLETSDYKHANAFNIRFFFSFSWRCEIVCWNCGHCYLVADKWMTVGHR